MLIDDLKLIKNVYCLYLVNKNTFEKLENEKNSIERIYDAEYYQEEYKRLNDQLEEIKKYPSMMEGLRTNYEEENKKNEAYNEELKEHYNKMHAKEGKKDALISFLLNSLWIIFVSVALFLFTFFIIKNFNYNDKATETTGVIVGLCLGIALFGILTFFNAKKRINNYHDYIKSTFAYEHDNRRKNIVDLTKYSQESIETVYKQKIQEVNDEISELKKEEDSYKKQQEEKMSNFSEANFKQFKSNVITIKECLDNLIENSPLHKNYSSFLQICQFIQYLDTGRCTELEGPYGCYNLYETELRANRIIAELAEINNSLSEIKNSMEYLIRQVDVISYYTKSLLEELKEIKIIQDNKTDADEETMKHALSSIEKNTSLVMACTAFNSEKNLPMGLKTRMIGEAFRKL